MIPSRYQTPGKVSSMIPRYQLWHTCVFTSEQNCRSDGWQVARYVRALPMWQPWGLLEEPQWPPSTSLTSRLSLYYPRPTSSTFLPMPWTSPPCLWRLPFFTHYNTDLTIIVGSILADLANLRCPRQPSLSNAPGSGLGREKEDGEWHLYWG